jgi:hypothetical protein
MPRAYALHSATITRLIVGHGHRLRSVPGTSASHGTCKPSRARARVPIVEGSCGESSKGWSHVERIALVRGKPGLLQPVMRRKQNFSGGTQ